MEDSTITVCADSLTTFSDGPATSIALCAGTSPSNGTTMINGTCVDYTPNMNFVGMDTVCVVSCNGTLCDTSIVIITVTPVNDEPVATNDTIVVDEDDTGVIIDVQDNDTDPDMNMLTTTIVTNPTSGGTVTVVNGDSISYTPPMDFVGNDTIVYSVCDNGVPCLLYTSPSPRDQRGSRMPSSA